MHALFSVCLRWIKFHFPGCRSFLLLAISIGPLLGMVWYGLVWLVWVELAEFWYVKAWFGGPWTFGFACAATPLNSRFRFTRFEFPLQAATTTASELPESDCCWPSCSSCCLGYCARFCWHRCYYFDSATRTHTHTHTHKDPGRHPAPSLI